MFKATIKLTLLIAIGITGNTQEVINTSKFKAKNYWGICLTPLLLAKADINGDKDKYQLHSLPQIGGELLINYYWNFRPQYYLVFGAGVNASAYNFNYYIPGEMFDPPAFDVSSNKAVSRESGIFNFRLQLEMQRKWSNDEAKNWDLSVGASLLASSTFDWGNISETLIYPNGDQKEFLTRTNDYANDGKPWFNFHISGGHEWILRAKNILQVNLKLNFSPTDFVTGTYHFNTGIPPDLGGTYTLSGSYIGLSIAYLFGRTQNN